MLQNQCTYLTAECTATACPSLCRRITTSSHTPDSSSASNKRHYSTELPDYQTVDPYVLLEDDLKYIFRDIRQVSTSLLFFTISNYQRRMAACQMLSYQVNVCCYNEYSVYIQLTRITV